MPLLLLPTAAGELALQATAGAVLASAVALGVLLLVDARRPPRDVATARRARPRRRRAVRRAWLTLLDDVACSVATGVPLPDALLEAGRCAPQPLRRAFRRAQRRLAVPPRPRPLDAIVAELAPLDEANVLRRITLLHQASPPDLAVRVAAVAGDLHDAAVAIRPVRAAVGAGMLALLTTVVAVRAGLGRELLPAPPHPILTTPGAATTAGSHSA